MMLFENSATLDNMLPARPAGGHCQALCSCRVNPTRAEAHRNDSASQSFRKISRAAAKAVLKCTHESGVHAVNSSHLVSSSCVPREDTTAPAPHSGHVAMTELTVGCLS